MTSTRLQATARRKSRALPLRSWRTAVSLTALTGGAAAVAGCLLPWATVFAGLVAFPGTRGTNGKLLAAAGVLIAAAGIWHLVRGGPASRWVAGTGGAAVLGYAGYLLLRLAASLRQPGGDSMMLLRGGPGLWVVAAGGLLAFTTLFFPASSQTVLRTTSEDGSGLLRQAADRDSMGPRRWLQIALGLVWLLDAALQYQPYMFTRGFVTRIVEPASMGNPGLISNSVMGSSQLMLSHIVIFNALFATIQLAIGLGLLWRQTSRAALACSIVWALGVWWLGEGLGGILTGSANPVTGAPGAALIYVIIAVLAWPPRPGAQTSRPSQRRITAGSIAAGSRIGLRSAQLTWAVLWASSAYFIVQVPNRPPGRCITPSPAWQAASRAGSPPWTAGQPAPSGLPALPSRSRWPSSA